MMSKWVSARVLGDAQPLDITSGTLKNYLQRSVKTRTKQRRKKESTHASPTHAVTAVPPAATQSPASARSFPVIVRPVPAENVAPPGTFFVPEDSEI